MFEFLMQKTFAPFVLRLALAVIFIFHGLDKINAETSWGANWNPQMHTALQIPVAYGELIGGIALAFGFLTRLAALGLGSIMGGAIVVVHGSKGFSLRDGGFEYNFALIAMCLGVVLMGPGLVALDCLLFPPKKKS